MKTDIITALQATDTFQDYNFEGANITVLIELIAYLGDINTFYMNRISKELYLDTVELYENAHRLAQLSGYTPLGHVASSGTATISLTQATSGTYFDLGDTLYVPKFKVVTSTIGTETVDFVVNDNTYSTVTLDFVTDGSSAVTAFEFDVAVKQGTGETYNYVGSDIANNKIQLPFYNYDHTAVLGDETSIWLTVNDVAWQRVNTFFEDISGIENEYNLYRFVFDKYKKYYIEFSSNLNVPSIEDSIQIQLIKTDGADGNVGANLIEKDETETQLVYNSTKSLWIPLDNISLTNARPSTGGVSYESIDTLKDNALAFAHSQFRCTTKADYKNYLEKRSTITKGVAWGQQELTYQSDTRDYNKIYLSLIPATWGLGSISYTEETWTLNNSNSTTIIVPSQYLSSFKTTLETYFEPYKMMNTYHSYVLPDLIHLSLDASIAIYTNYNYSLVINDIKNKLDYLFDDTRVDFGETIDFRDIEKNILDTTIESDDDTFSYIRGIKYFKIREMHVNTDVYEPNYEQNYPQYKTDTYSSYVDNTLRTILLGPGQFPIFKSDVCNFTNEA